MRKLFLLGIILLLSLSLVNAATVHGTIYDLSLDKVAAARVTVNSVPSQTFISKDGTYSFELGAGAYTLKAIAYEDQIATAEAEETIIVEDDGSYVIDLVLFPTIDGTDEEILADDAPLESSTWYYYAGPVFIIGSILGFLRYRKLKRQKLRQAAAQHQMNAAIASNALKSLNDPELQKVLDIIKSNSGRLTQKELRRSMPSLSEAKISLMVAELEHKGYIEKIKKGRGNLILLKK